MVFTAHNILLPDGSETLPGRPLTADTGICQAALRDLKLALPGGGRIADVGCLEGGYAVEFARAGYDVLGVEARPANMASCEYVADALDLPGLRFVQDDARSLHHHGEFDAVFCCGLLYHLDEPVSFLNMLGKVTRRLLILQTHYSAQPDAVNEGRSGHWYQDDPAADSRWGSWGNQRSFWLAVPDLLDAIRAAGFPLVYRQFDYLDDITAGSYAYSGHPRDRGMFTGVKP
jgi:SAM-dependent methyltransferase